MAGALSAVIGAAIAVAHVLDAGEPHWIATRSFVRAQITQAVDTTNRSIGTLNQQATRTEVQVLRSQRESIVAKIKDRELLLQQDGPPNYKRLVDEQITEFKGELTRQDRKIQDLEDKLRGMRQ